MKNAYINVPNRLSNYCKRLVSVQNKPKGSEKNFKGITSFEVLRKIENASKYNSNVDFAYLFRVTKTE